MTKGFSPSDSRFKKKVEEQTMPPKVPEPPGIPVPPGNQGGNGGINYKLPPRACQSPAIPSKQ